MEIRQVLIVYQKELASQAKQIQNYLGTNGMPIFLFELSENSVLNYDNESKLFEKLGNSNLIVPILYPIQKASKSYSIIRDYIEIISRSDEKEKIVFPVFVEFQGSIDEKEARTPKSFFENKSSFFWKIDDEKNLINFSEKLNKFHDLIIEKKEIKERQKEEVKKSTSDFIKPTIDDLRRREKKLKITALVWSILGYFSLLSTIPVGLSMIYVSDSEINASNFQLTLSLVIGKVLVIALLIAASRYSFSFSKTYMNESLKNSDRIHAILFGELYFKVFEDKIVFEHFKDVFQSWNTSGDGSFLTLSSNDFDPKVLDKLKDILTSVKSGNNSL